MVGHARWDEDDAVPHVNERSKATTERTSRKSPRSIPTFAPPSSLCAVGCEEFSRRGPNASAARWTCLQCGYVASGAKTAVETHCTFRSPNMHIMPESRRGVASRRSWSVGKTCKCLYPSLQYRDINRAMSVRAPVIWIKGLQNLSWVFLTKRTHGQLARFSTRTGTELVSLADDAIVQDAQ